MYIAILGRQPNLSMAELESCFGADKTRWFSADTALIDTDRLDINRLGGTLKAGVVTLEAKKSDWPEISRQIVDTYSDKLSASSGKITLGISAYGFKTSARDVQRVGITIKNNLKKSGVSLRLIPNADPALNTAASHHNKLGLSPNKIELLIVRNESGAVIVAESSGSQNITALARRDQARPKRDPFVGMLPPKLAQIMLNLAAGPRVPDKDRLVLDPFCGTGVVLQEALLQGYSVFGTDLNPKMVEYTQKNLAWLKNTHRVKGDVFGPEQADATSHTWTLPKQKPLAAVVSETYLGQPFSAPPAEKKLEEVRRTVDHITTDFLKNIHPQLPSNTPLCLAVPAWRSGDGALTHLPLIRSLESLGYSQTAFKNIDEKNLIYFREDQVVARQLLVLSTA